MGINCLLVFQKLFSFFYPFFKPLKISLKFRSSPALKTTFQYKVTETSENIAESHLHQPDGEGGGLITKSDFQRGANIREGGLIEGGGLNRAFTVMK